MWSGSLKFLSSTAAEPTIFDTSHAGKANGFANKAAFLTAIGR